MIADRFYRDRKAYEIELLRAKITAAAAFLDGLAHRLIDEREDWQAVNAAAECRAMAAKLRGDET